MLFYTQYHLLNYIILWVIIVCILVILTFFGVKLVILLLNMVFWCYNRVYFVWY